MVKTFCRKQYFLLIKKLNMEKSSSVGTSAVQSQSYEGEKLIYPAASRNKEPILQVLKRIISCPKHRIDDESPLFLEIAAGSGQHAAHFAPHFPGIRFQPTDVDASLMGSMNYYAKACPTKNIEPPIEVDICEDLSQYGFKENSVDYIYCANLIHISPFACTMGLFRNAGAYLKPASLMITYGPYCVNGIITPQSNIDFNTSLRSRDSSWGLRDICDLEKLGKANNLSLIEIIEMPSNNKTLIWKKIVE